MVEGKCYGTKWREVRQKVEGEILHFALFEGSRKGKTLNSSWFVVFKDFIESSVEMEYGGPSRGHREGTDMKHVFKEVCTSS